MSEIVWQLPFWPQELLSQTQPCCGSHAAFGPQAAPPLQPQAPLTQVFPVSVQSV